VRPLTEWVLGQALARCAQWRAAGHQLRVTINVSARTLLDPALPQAVLAAAETAGVPTAAVRLEIPESDVADDPAAAAVALRRLADVGVMVALDDVCAAFPALTRLNGTMPDEIKIDPTLTGAVRGNAAAHQAVAALVRFANSLGIAAVAEGVEDDGTRRAVTALGCDAVQGYAICPPLPGEELTDWLATHAVRPPDSALALGRYEPPLHRTLRSYS